jgi:hypothetical protein
VRRLLARVARAGWRHAFEDSSPGWLAVGVSASALYVFHRSIRWRVSSAQLRLVQRAVGGGRAGTSFELHPGEGVQIRAVDPPR